jgi:hypothetical protein
MSGSGPIRRHSTRLHPAGGWQMMPAADRSVCRTNCANGDLPHEVICDVAGHRWAVSDVAR